MHILGTAGHVDHGKSSLVRALTGTDPDRWIEERLRGMTLDLGFAHLRFPDGIEAGIIDVPGHERFLHNMLAGAAGMELLLLTVAANEGPKSQTAEHLAILQYLNVRRTIIVLTKCDTVDADDLAFAEELVREAVAGTIAADAPVVPISSTSGEGLERLRGLIHDELAALPARAPDAPAYLPIDRVFALEGHGTIVTGTLMQGTIAVGDTLALTPRSRHVRARSLQVFGERRDVVAGGARVAINLPGIERNDIARGAVLASPQFEARSEFGVRFRPIAGTVALLRRRMAVRAYIGSDEILGILVFETLPHDASDTAAMLYLRRPTVVVPDGAFVVRRLSPKTLLGGGTIAAATVAEPATDDVVPEIGAVTAALVAAGPHGRSAAALGAAANVREDVAADILAQLVEEGRALILQRPAAFVAADVANSVVERVHELLRASERQMPWLAGMTALGLARALDIAEPTLLRILAAAALDGRLAARAGYYATPGFVPELSPAQQAFFSDAFAGVGDGPLEFGAFAASLKASNVNGLPAAFETLLASGAIVRVGDAVYRGTYIAAVQAKLEAALRRDKRITMAGFRDLIGSSRRFAVPLLEWFDSAGVTIRAGDDRVLRTAPAQRNGSRRESGSPVQPPD